MTTTIIQRLIQPYTKVTQLINSLQPVALLAARLYVAWVFFAAGLTKIKDWDSTLFLFEEEYHVPFIPFELAAYLGTAGEIVLPILLVLGLAGRFSALGLSFINIIAVISLAEIAPAALYLHILWGVLLLQILLFSSDKISVDKLIAIKLKNRL